MKLLLTSAGMSNPSIHNALVELLGKPVAESNALFIPTSAYALPIGPDILYKVIRGTIGDPFCEMGWKSLGLLELTALPSLKKELWTGWLEQADVLLVGGGDCQYLTYWMKQSGLAEMLPSLFDRIVYVGLSAGSVVMTRYGTTFGLHTLPPETPRYLGLLEMAILPHMDHEMFPEWTQAKLEKIAATLTVPSYLIDDQTAIKVTEEGMEVISEGRWKLFTP
ncbi:Type 1 glutamine amidotransferase-like domain-containing protein [Terriglobus tenax]|uniref:Type 1 glutamine amidotransferase-like domain-containing protein n=1 Tax=Terriglobus tenax TaxID=1111115 RepID=UPI0021E05A68|nr:Type 1 glutamine amidotransferase-like domain-containing protein [Terriglobus tenax]